jgi:hypothetical protein
MARSLSKRVDVEMLELGESILLLLENEIPEDTWECRRLTGQLNLIAELRSMGFSSLEDVRPFFKKAGVHAIDALFWGMKREGIPLSRMKDMTYEELYNTVGKYKGVYPTRIQRFMEVRHSLFELLDKQKSTEA